MYRIEEVSRSLGIICIHRFRNPRRTVGNRDMMTGAYEPGFPVIRGSDDLKRASLAIASCMTIPMQRASKVRIPYPQVREIPWGYGFSAAARPRHGDCESELRN